MQNALSTTICALFSILLLPNVQSKAGDWPQLLGPTRNGISTEEGLLAKLSAKPEGARLPELWAIDVGSGFSGPVVAAGRVVVFHRLANEEVIDCVDAKTGKRAWRVSDPVDYGGDYDSDDGPKATPAIANGRVYTFGIAGRLQCIALDDGSRQWSFDTGKTLGARAGYFGMGCSPLVDDGRVYVNVGGRDGAGVVAFDSTSGKVIWKATRDAASYSSPTLATVGGLRRLFVFTRLHLVGIDPATGRVDFEFPWGKRGPTVNAAVPLVLGKRVFVSTSYGVGAALLGLELGSGDGAGTGDAGTSAPAGRLVAKKLWTSNDAMTNHYATCVEKDGCLYGFHGRHEYGPELRCVELETGKVRWTTGRVEPGSILMAGDKLLVFYESGKLVVAEPKPEKFVELRRLEVQGAGARAIPAISNGRLYTRDASKVRCASLE